MSTDNLLDELLSGGGKTFFGKGDQPGKSVTGTVTAVSVRQTISLDTGKPEFWDDDGQQPKRQAVITLATAERDPADPEDDGRRNVYDKMWGDQRRALAKAGTPAVGDTLTATFTGETPSTVMGMSPAKNYAFTLVKANPVAEAMAAPEPSGPPAWATGDPQGATSSSTAPTTPAPAAAPPAGAPDVSKVPNLRAAGLTDEQIVAATGLSLAQVQGA